VKETFGDSIGRTLGRILDRGLRYSVEKAAKILGADENSSLIRDIKEIAGMAGSATGRTVGRLYDFGSGLAKAAGGMITKNEESVKEGLITAGGAAVKTVGAAAIGLLMMTGKAAEAASNAGFALISTAAGDEEGARKHWDKAKEGLLWMGKAAVASTVALGPLEAVGVTDFLPDGDADGLPDGIPDHDPPLSADPPEIGEPGGGILHPQVVDDHVGPDDGPVIMGHDGLTPQLVL